MNPTHNLTQRREGAETAKADAFSIAPKALNILRHAIGYDDAGNDRYPNARTMDERRNRFVTGESSTDWDSCQTLCATGFLFDHGPLQLAGGDHFFAVTDAGKEVVRLHKPVAKKLTRSQRRYQAFLDADGGMKFGEWLKVCAAQKRRFA